MGKLGAKGAAAMDLRVEGREQWERGPDAVLGGGGGRALMPSRESHVFGCKGVMKKKRLLSLKRAGGKKEALTGITFPILVSSFDPHNTPKRWVSFAFYR